MNPLRGGFPEGGGLKINRRARSLSVGTLAAGALGAGVVDEGKGGLEAPGGFGAPWGLPGVLWGLEGWSGIDAPGWLVG